MELFKETFFTFFWAGLLFAVLFLIRKYWKKTDVDGKGGDEKKASPEKLVEAEEDVERQPSSERLVPIGIAKNQVEAAVLKSYLESHGILAQIEGMNFRANLGWEANYVEMRVLVPEEFSGEATALLKDFQSQKKSDAGDGPALLPPLAASKPVVLYTSCYLLPGLGNRYGGNKTLGKILNGLAFVCMLTMFALFYFMNNRVIERIEAGALGAYFFLAFFDAVSLAVYRNRKPNRIKS